MITDLNRLVIGDERGDFSIVPSLSYNVDHRCNMACEYCPPFYENYQKTERRLSANVACLFFQAAAQCSVKTFRLSGGEPLLSPQHVMELAETVRRFGTTGAHVRLNTNGLLLARYAESLKLAGVDVAKVSLDTLDKDRFKELTGSPTLGEVLRGIEKALSVGMRVEINMVYLRKNVHDFGALLDYCIAMGIPVLKVLDLVEYDDPAYWAQNYISPQSLIESLREKYPQVHRTALSGGRGVRMLEFDVGSGTVVIVKDCRQGATYSRSFCEGCNHFPCQEGFYNLTLNSDGKLKPCRIIKDKFVDIVDLAEQNGDVLASFKSVMLKMLDEHYRVVYFNERWAHKRKKSSRLA